MEAALLQQQAGCSVSQDYTSWGPPVSHWDAYSCPPTPQMYHPEHSDMGHTMPPWRSECGQDVRFGPAELQDGMLSSSTTHKRNGPRRSAHLPWRTPHDRNSQWCCALARPPPEPTLGWGTNCYDPSEAPWRQPRKWCTPSATPVATPPVVPTPAPPLPPACISPSRTEGERRAKNRVSPWATWLPSTADEERKAPTPERGEACNHDPIPAALEVGGDTAEGSHVEEVRTEADTDRSTEDSTECHTTTALEESKDISDDEAKDEQEGGTKPEQEEATAADRGEGVASAHVAENESDGGGEEDGGSDTSPRYTSPLVWTEGQCSREMLQQSRVDARFGCTASA